MKKEIGNCFDKFDLNHDGFLDYPEVLSLVQLSHCRKGSSEEGEAFYRDAADKLIRNVGREEPGRISREEFYRFYKNL